MKSRNLEILKENGFNVPNFEVIKWENRNQEIDSKKYKGKYAIRSSAYLEDGATDSFAGQFDTYLNVKPNQINKKVQECFHSTNHKNIKDYLKEKKKTREEIKMDVIIQEMVDSEYSGVLFTSNPQGLLNETVIVVGKGLGNKVVEDRITTTTYYYHTTDQIYYYEGIRDYLKKETVEELIQTSNEIKEVLGEYLDIEFAIKKNQIYILQARPITTLNTNNITVLDNSNIVESYPGVSLPLTISFVKFVYSNIFKKEAYRLSKNRELIEMHTTNFDNMVASCNGRLYYKISNWYTLIHFLPFSKKIIPIWQDMLGIKNKSYDKNGIKVPLKTKIKIYYNTIKELHNVSQNMEQLNEKFIKIHDEFYRNFKPNSSNKQIFKYYRDLKENILDDWDITLVNDLYAFIYTGLLKKRLLKKKYPEETINDYISGISNIESLKPIKNLINLAYQKDKVSKEEYKLMFDHYITQYGDRNLEELKLESETFRTNPKLLKKKVKEYRKDKDKLVSLYLNLNGEKEKIIKVDRRTRKLSKKAMQGIKNREISRLNRSRIYGMVRLMFLEIGKNYVKEKKLRKKEDIFYLTIEEVFNHKKQDYKKLVSKRKKEYKIYEELPSYTRLLFSEKEFDKHPKRVNTKEKEINKDVLEGTATSNGLVEAEALVITDNSKKQNVKDKILVTKMTDPGWVFLLATAKGVISEKGSILSHTAIISREIKIPAIVGVEDATTIIKTGDYIRLDAYTGQIEILKRRKK